jgi:indole-3-glycerol phosphate synthase
MITTHTILDEIVLQKHKEVALLKQQKTYADFEKMLYFTRTCHSLKQNIASSSFGIIAEIKRKSPSAGIIREEIDLIQQAKLYEMNQVSGISVLTDFEYFGGTVHDLEAVRNVSTLPLLRKEFIIDEIQILEAKAHGADAILLIAEILSEFQIKSFTTLAQSIGLEVLLELHEPAMLHRIYDQVDIIGVNNRDLKLQETRLQTSVDLFPFLPPNILKITESGIKTQEELLFLKEVGYQGALIGESILKNHLKIEELCY